MKNWSALESKVNDQQYSRDRPMFDERGYDGLLHIDIRKLIGDRLKQQHPVRVLDIGCGEATALEELRRAFSSAVNKGNLQLEGVDLRIEQFCPQMRLYQCNIDRFAPVQPYDVIFSVFCLPYVADKLRTIEHIYNKILKVNGEAHLTLHDYLIYFGNVKSNLKKILKRNNRHMDLSFHKSNAHAGAITMKKKGEEQLQLPGKLCDAFIVEVGKRPYGTSDFIESRYARKLNTGE